jgi:hypothetical protein
MIWIYFAMHARLMVKAWQSEELVCRQRGKHRAHEVH